MASTAWPVNPIDDILPYLEHRVLLEGPGGTEKHTIKKGSISASFSLTPGLWKVTVEAYCMDKLFAKGEDSVQITAGKNNAATLFMQETGRTTGFFTVATGTDWSNGVDGAVDIIKAGGSNKDYVIILTNDVIVNGTTADTFGSGVTNITVTITGNKTLSLSSTPGGYLLYIGNNQTVIAQDVKLKGLTPSYCSVVLIYTGGAFTMQGSASVYGSIINTGDNGGGVYVSGNGATFIMQDSASVHGNGSQRGGGVYVSGSGATFTMKGSASVHDNIITTSGDNGGGVYVNTSGRFTMQGNSSVYNNTANNQGGGVFVFAATFYIEGGTVYGSDAATGQKNNAATGVALYSSGPSTAQRGTFGAGGTWTPKGDFTIEQTTIKIKDGEIVP